MSYKISILTPIHISSGNKNACFSYHPGKNDHFNYYKIEDLLQSIPPEKLLDLKLNNPSNNGKREIIQLFNKHVNYSCLKPQYFVFYKFKPFSLDVIEQIKTLGKPYIPGSSIKGTIMNAIIYNLLKDNEAAVNKFLNSYNTSLSKKFENNLLSSIFGHEFDEAFKFFSSCICCEDIYFESMILCDSKRLNMAKNSPEFNKYECIDNLQEKESDLFFIDENKKSIFLNKYKDNDKIKTLRLFFSKRNIIIACRNYYRAVINDDKKYFIKDDFNYFKDHDFEGRSQIIDFLNNISFEDKDICYLRIGNSTNYFYKSVSIFIKNKFNNFYEDNFYLFSPTGLNKKDPPKPDTMPKTRIVFEYDNECYLPGFIKIEPNNKS